MKPKTNADWRGAARKAPFSFFTATGFGLGLLPQSPGTFGSLLGVALTILVVHATSMGIRFVPPASGWWGAPHGEASFLANQLVLSAIFLAWGLWAAERTGRALQEKDPQIIVVDEVSGQLITYLGLHNSGSILHGWKYLLAGFILFRVFDIWKPFPIRRAERLPGGWGIMADDWLAGAYAACVLWGVRAAGL